MTVDHKVPMKPDPTFATTPKIVNASRSPRDAARGVARLSEFMDRKGISTRKYARRPDLVAYLD